MKLSIVIPSNRANLLSYSRIMGASSWASDDVEIIVRDNSESKIKKKVLSAIDHPNCHIFHCSLCDEFVNFTESIKLATGDFVLFVADDDLVFDRSITSIVETIEKFGDDESVIGITGPYVWEERGGSRIFSYSGIDSDNASVRLDGYIGLGPDKTPNFLFYSAVRRDLVQKMWNFICRIPIHFYLQDLYVPLIYTMGGRIVQINRLFSVIDNGNWENMEVSEKKNINLFERMGLDPAIQQLHTMISAFEGAVIILQSEFGARYSASQRQALATKWFSVMAARPMWGGGGTKYSGQAQALREKWRRTHPNYALDALRSDICEFIALFAPEKAAAYDEFWRSLVH